jgi:UDP-glucose 4-epimerase
VLDWSARDSDLATIVATAARWHARHKSAAHTA